MGMMSTTPATPAPAPCPYGNTVGGLCLSSKDIADMVLQALFVDFDPAVVETLLDVDYIQHNPTVPTGAAPVLQFIPALQQSGLGIEVHRTLEMENLVAYHSTYTNATLFGGETLVGFDIFRVEGGVVKEHWDNLQALSGPSPSNNSMTDGETVVADFDMMEDNKALVTAFIETILIDGEFDQITEFISQDEYIQHNPQIADGLEGLNTALMAFAEAGINLIYYSVELIVAQGNFVLAGSLGDLGGPTAYYDLFRIKDGLIVEHWDVIQAIPAAEAFQHDNGKF
jgi:predicted SnoaL-like aldol condensation-catalyzing enzyme